jgi:hypothetical protein
MNKQRAEQEKITKRLLLIVLALAGANYHPDTWAGPLWMRCQNMDGLWGRFATRGDDRKVVDIKLISPAHWSDFSFGEALEELGHELGYLRAERYDPKSITTLVISLSDGEATVAVE